MGKKKDRKADVEFARMRGTIEGLTDALEIVENNDHNWVHRLNQEIEEAKIRLHVNAEAEMCDNEDRHEYRKDDRGNARFCDVIGCGPPDIASLIVDGYRNEQRSDVAVENGVNGHLDP